MSIIGLDLGSHHASIAIWFPEKEKENDESSSSNIEVIADDLGSRTIPTAVAFRHSTSPGNSHSEISGCEVLSGSAAVSQQHKNPSNTFDDIRKLLSASEPVPIKVPALDKELSVQDLTSHFFRNIHNQVKQQVGKAVRDCIVTIPDEGSPFSLSAEALKRLTEAAQAGGLRIKSFISDSAASLLAYGLDVPDSAPRRTLVLDVGWSKTELTLLDVSGGLFVPVTRRQSAAVSGSVFVGLLADHCAKDFTRKTKVPLTAENSRSMLRLRRECEGAVKALSTGQEATLDLDSLCEGADYSSKISRARFEDLLAGPLAVLRGLLGEISAAALDQGGPGVQQVCLCGGPSALPRIVHTAKTLFPSAAFPSPRGRFEPSEAQCMGAAVHGKQLQQQGLLEAVPSSCPSAVRSLQAVYLSSTASPSLAACLLVLEPLSCLPARRTLQASLCSPSGYLQLLLGDALRPLGDLVFSVPAGLQQVSVSVAASEDGSLSLEVSDGERVLASLSVPAL